MTKLILLFHAYLFLYLTFRYGNIPVMLGHEKKFISDGSTETLFVNYFHFKYLFHLIIETDI